MPFSEPPVNHIRKITWFWKRGFVCVIHIINPLFRTSSKPYTKNNMILKTRICLCDTYYNKFPFQSPWRHPWFAFVFQIFSFSGWTNIYLQAEKNRYLSEAPLAASSQISGFSDWKNKYLQSEKTYIKREAPLAASPQIFVLSGWKKQIFAGWKNRY